MLSRSACLVCTASSSAVLGVLVPRAHPRASDQLLCLKLVAAAAPEHQVAQPTSCQCPQRVCRFFALKHGNAMFHEGGTIGKRVTWSSNDDHLRRWKEGQTGLPLVDANMRELAQTGGAAACLEPAVTGARQAAAVSYPAAWPGCLQCAEDTSSVALVIFPALYTVELGLLDNG